MSEEQKLRWHYTPTRKAHIMQMGGLVTGRYSDMTPNAPIQVARSKEAETTIQHHMVYMDPMEHVQELWEDLQQKLIAFQRSNCVTFVGKLVLRAETENHLVYFWLEAQIHARVKNFGYDELLKNEKRESLPKSWSEEDFLEKYGVQFALPQDIPVRNV